MSDANKTLTTKEVTEASIAWLGARGFRPIETECDCADGWRADVAGFAYITRTEAQKLRLIKRRPNWGTGGQEAYDEWNEAYRLLPSPMTAVVEVKVSKWDFLKDLKFERAPVAHLQYLAYPAGLVDPKEFDNAWGLLSFSAGVVRTVRPPMMHTVSLKQTLRVCCEIGLRRDAFTANERMREVSRQIRDHDNQRITCARVSNAFRAVLDIQRGKYSAEEAVRMHFNRARLPRGIVEQLKELEQQS